MPRSTYWSGRSFAFPLFRRLGLHPDGETDDTVVQSISCSNTAPTDALNPYVDGSLHVTGGSSPGLWLRKAGAWVAAAVQSAAASFTTVTATTAVSTDTVSERTSAAGVTVDGVLLKDSQVTTDVILEKTSATGVTIDGALLKDGYVMADYLVVATIAVADITGSNDTTCTVTLKRADNTAAITSARQVLITTGATQYAQQGVQASVTFSAATVGSIVASGAGWALIQTSAAGAFACTVTNTDDETVYFAVTHPYGASDVTKGALVVASNSDAAVWA